MTLFVKNPPHSEDILPQSPDVLYFTLKKMAPFVIDFFINLWHDRWSQYSASIVLWNATHHQLLAQFTVQKDKQSETTTMIANDINSGIILLDQILKGKLKPWQTFKIYESGGSNISQYR